MTSKRKEAVKTDPTKEFFVYMITKDIGLDECVIDLMDNCADGARRMLMSNGSAGAGLELNYKGFSVDVTFSSNKFVIEDNCGGIAISLAKEYAFRFGRRPDTPDDLSYGIGIFGIGMKRAIFKMGQKILVESSTASEAFKLDIDVNKWIGDPDEWDFELEHADKWDKPGTRITVEQLFPGISSEYGDSNFETKLIRQIGIAYSIFIQKGLTVTINTNSVKPFIPEFLSSEVFQAAQISYSDEETSVRINAGSSESPPDDSSAEATQERSSRNRAEKFGWYVVCNDRVVVAADKTDQTVWGDDDFAVWHPQYNGFIGLVYFDSKDPNNLPLTTTKGGVDQEHPIYHRAVSKMKDVTREFTKYTTRRKADLEAAKRLEKEAEKKPISRVVTQTPIKFPTITRTPRVEVANILYQKPLTLVRKVAKALGRSRMSYKEVGERTFNYYVENEGVD